jgi:hypothetical protein
MTTARSLCLLVACALMGGCAVREPGAAPPPEHWLVTVRLTDAGAELVDARRVSQPLPKVTRGPWRARVLDAKGEALYAVQVPAADVLRGEFHGADGGIESVRVQRRESALAVRLPVLPDAATLVIEAPPERSSQEGVLAPGEAPRAVERGRVALPRGRP